MSDKDGLQDESSSSSESNCKWRWKNHIRISQFLACHRWTQVMLYQLCFTLLLSIYTGLMLQGYLSSIDTFKPRIKNPHRNQALSFRPLPNNPMSTLIHFKHGNAGNWQHLKESLTNFVEPYTAFGKFAGPSEKCSWSTKLDSQNRCHVSVRKWVDFSRDVECTKAEAFGYIRGFPCIALKMNRIFGWEPSPYYNVSEVLLNPDIPKEVKKLVQKTWTQFCSNKTKAVERDKCPRLRMVWVTCQGATSADIEYLGPVRYMPIQGFPGYFFPFLNQQHYLSPIVWIQFTNIYPGALISVECKLWAKNIRHDPRDPFVGGVRFEVLMD